MNFAKESMTVWITGAAGSLGRALVGTFSRAGYNVVASTHHSQGFESCPKLFPMAVDVTQQREIRQAAHQIWERFQRLDVLVHCAGVTRDSILAKQRTEDWLEVLDIHLKGAFLLVQAASELMVSSQGGHVLLIGSLSGLQGHVGQSNYAAAKAGLVGFMQSAARELAPANIRINTVLPGIMESAMTDKLPSDRLRALVESNLLKRLNDPVEVAEFILHLAGMRNVSGQTFNLDSRIARFN